MSEILCEDAYVGRDRDGNRFYLTVTIRDRGPVTTIDHESLETCPEVSFSGVVIRKGGQMAHDGDWIRFGQCSDDLPLRLGVLRRLWERWHLNGLRSHCAHQDRAIPWDECPPCPVTGYKAGFAWLTEVPAPGVLDLIRTNVKRAVGDAR